MNKEKILQQILEKLSDDLNVLLHAAIRAHEASTHEENIADNKYDTLSLESSYIAQGQANRAQEIKETIESFKNLPLKSFEPSSTIVLSALITLEDEDGTPLIVFLGPKAGGLKIKEGENEIVVVTPASPLGRELKGKTVGDFVRIFANSGKKEYEIMEVW